MWDNRWEKPEYRKERKLISERDDARGWARRMMFERDSWRKQRDLCYDENGALRQENQELQEEIVRLWDIASADAANWSSSI